MSKSNGHQNRRSGMLAGGRGQSSVPKAKARAVKAGRKSLKASVKGQPRAERKARKLGTRRATKTSKAVPDVKRKAVTPQKKELERGRRLKELHQKGYSLAELGRRIGASKSLARDLVALASLPKDLEEAYLQQKIGRKTAVKMARARKKQVDPKSPVITTEPPNDTCQNSVPDLTEEEREKTTAENAQLIIDWVHSIDLAPCYWEDFFEQVKLGLYGPFRWFFSAEAPQPHEIYPGENPWNVIKRCKVERTNAQFVTDIINYLVTWLARWIQRIISDQAIIENAVDRARGHLLREAREVRGF